MEKEKLLQALKELWDSLTDEQREKVQACASYDELMQYAAEEGIELPLEALDDVAGGYTFYDQASHTYQVIRDKDGEVMVDNLVYLDNAQTNARYLGQSPDLITWEELDKLRKKSKGGGGC